jgi:lactoylglutathione lyase
MAHVEHIAIWTKNLELLKEFYVTYFGAKSSSKYINEKKGFESYFLSFESGTRIEIMKISGISDSANNQSPQKGYAHIAISVGSKEMVESLTNELGQSGFQIVGQPRFTGDGYFESVILDPDGNHLEIIV